MWTGNTAQVVKHKHKALGSKPRPIKTKQNKKNFLPLVCLKRLLLFSTLPHTFFSKRLEGI
jgi:hypothetical protein